jgi:type I restriction enzyme S subunit
MKKYQSYKPSDVFWYNEIPTEWSISKNKFVLKEQKNIVDESWKDYKLLSLTKKGVIERDIENSKGKFPEFFNTYKIIKKNDLIFCLYDIQETPRTIGISENEGMITGSYNVFQTNQNSKFIYYWFLIIDDVKGLKPFYTGMRNVVRNETFMSLKIFVPPLQEQEQIVKYLDEKTFIIDKLISTKERKIELLKEQRTSLINQVITKGLNPNVKMKDSGVEWIGEIPESWKITSLGKIGTLYGGLTGKSGDDFRSEENPMNKPFIPFTNIFNNTYISKDHFQYVVVGDNEKQNRVKKFDLFFLMSSEGYDDLGKSSILIEDVEEVYLNSFCKGFRVQRLDVYPLFLNYQLLGDTHKKLISIEGNGFTRINLRQDRLKETPIFLPSFQEQQEIVEYLDKNTKEIDDLVSMEQKKIELLKEYRQSLISEVITGKIKVVE